MHLLCIPFNVACGIGPENIINFQSGLTNNKPTLNREEVLGGQLSAGRAEGTQCLPSSRRKGDDNPQEGNALKLSTTRIKREKKEKKRNQRKEKGGEKHTATQAAAGQGNC